jgi:Cof subfamily protein (haloacid dehalogenase superfamily)
MIKLVACDLDGTLLSSFGMLSKEAADTLRQLRAHGVRVVISSGRPYYSVAHIIPEDCYDYASCMNGQDIYCAKDQKHTHKPDLTEEEKEHLVSYLKSYPMMMECSIDNQGYYIADAKHQSFVHFFQTMNALRHKLAHQKYYPQTASFDPAIVKNVSIGKFCYCGYALTLKRFYRHLDHENFSCFFVNASWLEIMHQGISKGSALQEIMEMEHLTKEECAAFGDGENDITLFDVCGTRVAMGNAMRSLKRHATDIARPYYEDGCAKWIQKHLL